MKKILWKLLKLIDSNHGYSTPVQERFKIGEERKISSFKTNEIKFQIGEMVKIVETGRHDYLVENQNGIKDVVYHFELTQE
jgi:hypothetical protein